MTVETKSCSRTQNQTVKDHLFPLRYTAKPDPSSLSDRIGSALSQEERQPLDCCWPAFRGTQNIRVSETSSTLFQFFKFPGETGAAGAISPPGNLPHRAFCTEI